MCPTCGKQLALGEWPFCGGRNNHGFPLHGVSIQDDQLEGGPRWFETLGHDPVFIESKSQLKREADARGLENVVRHDDHYYRTRRKWHDEKLRDTGSPY
jgi:hypothetical protein